MKSIKYRLSLAIITLIFSFNVYSQDCGTTTNVSTFVDTRLPGGTMEGIPVLDQNGMPFCYAYAASTAVTAFLRSRSTGLTEEEKRNLVVSPFATMLETRRRGQNCQHPCGIAESMSQEGACSNQNLIFTEGSNVRQFDAPQVVMDNCIRWEVPGVIRRHLQGFEDIVISSSRMTSGATDPGGLAHYRSALTERFERDYRLQNYHGLSAERANRLAQFAHETNNRDELALAVIAPNCSSIVESANGGTPKLNYTPNIRPGRSFGANGTLPNFQCSHQSDTAYNDYRDCRVNPTRSSPRQYLVDINNHFNQRNPQPMVIDYCAYILLQGPNHQRQWRNGAPRGCLVGKSNMEHKSVLIGRRLNPVTRQCEFLLRNSWGNDCNSYSQNGTPNLMQSCREELERTGHADIWIPSDWIIHNMHGYSTLSERSGG